MEEHKMLKQVLIRVGGGSFEDLLPLRLQDTLSILQQRNDCIQNLLNSRDRICNELFHLIQKYGNDSDVKTLINVKRDIYNMRDFTPRLKLITKNNKWIGQLHDLTDPWLKEFMNLKKIELESKGLFYEEAEATRRYLRSNLITDQFLCGVLISSLDLYREAIKYKQHSDSFSRKKAAQVEQGILKYLTRMHSKTSPFSTFTSIGMAHVTKDNINKEYLLHVPDKLKTKSKVLLNGYIYEHLWNYFISNKNLFHLLTFRLNPTLIHTSSGYRYLMNSRNLESIQRIQSNPVLTHLIDYLGTPDSKSDVNSLAHSFITNSKISLTIEEVEALIKKLLDFGFLEVILPAPGIDTMWLDKFIDNLKETNHKKTDEYQLIYFALIELKAYLAQYENSSSTERFHILNGIYNTLSTLNEKLALPKERNKNDERADENATGNSQPFRAIVKTGFQFKKEKLIYEDTYLSNSIEISNSKIAPIIKSVDSLLNKMELFQIRKDEVDTLLIIFLQKFNKDQRVSLLEFYEEYSKLLKELEKRPTNSVIINEIENKSSINIKEINALRTKGVEREQKKTEWLNLFKEYLKSKPTDAIELNISEADLSTLNHKISYTREFAQESSFGAFIQPYFRHNNAFTNHMAVLNTAFMGYGKLFSRFLHLFSSSFTSAIIKDNEELQGDNVMFLENTDASFFNANIHPHLMPFEVKSPGSHNRAPMNKQILVSDLYVQINSEGTSLDLINGLTNQKCYLFDLGFQGDKGRSPLFRLLNYFTKARYISYQQINNCVLDVCSTKFKGTTCIPRIIYENNLVIQRRRWLIPLELLPKKSLVDDEWAYFKICQEWLSKYSLPNEVFVYVTTLEDKDIKQEGIKVSSDDRKPQYICFSSPLLVTLFSKLVEKVLSKMVIEEVLPNMDNLIKIEREYRPSEWLIQWNSNAH